MKKHTLLLAVIIVISSSSAFAQMQLDNKIQLTGSGGDAKIEGIDEIINNSDAANKIYVDTAIANRSSSGPAACPSGYVALNDKVCIEINERSTALWPTANNTCMDANAQLCTFHNWIYACQKGGLGLSNMTNNWEWLGESVWGGSSSFMGLIGNGACDALNNGNLNSDMLSYRCCFSR